MTEVKGVIIHSIPKSILDKFGHYGLKRWLELISPHARNVYSSTVDQDAWFPLKETLVEPMANIAQLFYDWDLKAAAWDFGRMSADVRFHGVLKLLVKIPSATSLINKAGEFLASYYRPCSIYVPVKEPKFCVVRISQFPELDKTTEYRICGWMERALEISGCKEVKVDIVKSLTNFQPLSEYELRWK
ncbi:MAG: hypothetical protein MUP71_04510 [Candidatus Aminicenantes bacterium]|jgi:hypothetical protein|nr:hypothetical protein [Candidatus Aminicenantes bacterium]